MTPEPTLVDVIGQVGFENATFAGVVRSLLERDPHSPALRLPDALVSYGELAGRIGSAAALLSDAGVAVGEQVAVMLPNGADAVVAQLAVQTVGARSALVNTALRGEALRHIVSHSDAVLAVVDGETAGAIEDVRGGLPGLREVVNTADADARAALRGHADPSPWLGRVTAGPLDPASINYTSGTTGLPKGVVLKQIFSVSSLVLAARLGMWGADERLYLATPIYHALGLSFMLMGLRIGAELVIPPGFSASRYWDDVREHRCTFAYHVGTIAQMLYNQPPRASDAQHELRTFIGGGMPPDIWEAFAERFGVTIIEGYSASDSIGFIANYGDAPAGSFGRPSGGIEGRVVDGDDRPVEVGQVGELQLRSTVPLPGPPVEYYEDAGATEDKSRGGWVRTGDLVRAEADGNLFFVERMKDVIRRRGVNIAPAEIERIMCSDSAIGECAALAVPSELGEDEIKLVVVGADDVLTPARVADLASGVLPEYMRPRYVELVAELPKTITERVQRYRLKQGWRTAGTWDVAAGSYLDEP